MDGQTTDNPAAIEKKIIAIGGAKGGVGKSLFSAALGIWLANLDKKVVVVDANFGNSYLNILFNMDFPRQSLKDIIANGSNLNSVLVDTNHPNLKFISGAVGVLGMSEYWNQKSQIFINNLRQLDADYLLLDLDSGNSIGTITLFSLADLNILISNSDPLSIQESFLFIKLCQYEKLKHQFAGYPKIQIFLKNTFEKNNKKNYLVLRKVMQTNQKFKINSFRPKLILNKVQDEAENLEAYALQIICDELLGIHLDYWGGIEYNGMIRKLIKNHEYDQILSNNKIMKIAERIVKNGNGESNNNFRGIKSRKIDYMNNDEVICSVNCSLWNQCSRKRGGYPCKIKFIGFINTYK